LCFASELRQVPESRQQCILDCVLGTSGVPEVAHGVSMEGGRVARYYILHLSLPQIQWTEFNVLRFVAYC
jgi:hypothetical protein